MFPVSTTCLCGRIHSVMRYLALDRDSHIWIWISDLAHHFKKWSQNGRS